MYTLGARASRPPHLVVPSSHCMGGDGSTTTLPRGANLKPRADLKPRAGVQPRADLKPRTSVRGARHVSPGADFSPLPRPHPGPQSGQARPDPRVRELPSAECIPLTAPRPSVPRAPIDRARRSTRGQASRPPRFIVLRHGLILTNGSAAVPPWAPAMVLSLQRGKTPTYEKSMATRRPQSPRALPCDRSRRYDRA